MCVRDRERLHWKWNFQMKVFHELLQSYLLFVFLQKLRNREKFQWNEMGQSPFQRQKEKFSFELQFCHLPSIQTSPLAVV